MIFLLVLVLPQALYAQWIQKSLPSGTIFDAVEYPAPQVVYVSHMGDIYKSLDAGTTWTGVPKQFTNYDPAKYYLFGMSAPFASLIFVGTHYFLLFKSDSGSSRFDCSILELPESPSSLCKQTFIMR